MHREQHLCEENPVYLCVLNVTLSDEIEYAMTSIFTSHINVPLTLYRCLHSWCGDDFVTISFEDRLWGLVKLWDQSMISNCHFPYMNRYIIDMLYRYTISYACLKFCRFCKFYSNIFWCTVDLFLMVGISCTMVEMVDNINKCVAFGFSRLQTIWLYLCLYVGYKSDCFKPRSWFSEVLKYK